MKTAFALIALTVLGGCSADNKQNWLIASWDGEIFIIEHAGYTFKAACDIGANNNLINPRCDLAIGLVGHSIGPDLRPTDGREKDQNGWTGMSQSGSMLILSRW